jgi:dolichol kinase
VLLTVINGIISNTSLSGILQIKLPNLFISNPNILKYNALPLLSIEISLGILLIKSICFVHKFAFKLFKLLLLIIPFIVIFPYKSYNNILQEIKSKPSLTSIKPNVEKAQSQFSSKHLEDTMNLFD